MERIEDRLFRFVEGEAYKRTVADVRIGLGYTAVMLDNGLTGLAWTPPREGSGCTHLDRREFLAGCPALELLGFLDSSELLMRAIGFATVNALLADEALRPREISGEDALALLEVGDADRVAMVGYFGPLVPKLRQKGCRLDIIEKNRALEGTVDPDRADEILAGCDVAIITATSLVNNTFNGLVAALDRPRRAVLLGPSAPLCPQAFAGTPITQISGSRVLDGDKVLRTVSEGGGTPRLKPYVAFETTFSN